MFQSTRQLGCTAGSRDSTVSNDPDRGICANRKRARVRANGNCGYVDSRRLLTKRQRRESRQQCRQPGGVMRTFSIFIKSFVCAVALLSAASLSCAQSDRGSIAGTVEDSTGSVVSNAQVVAKAKDSAAQYSATTGPTGGYRIPDVKIGIYTITVTAGGFKTSEKTGVEVQVNTVASVDFSLTIGAVNETVTII